MSCAWPGQPRLGGQRIEELGGESQPGVAPIAPQCLVPSADWNDALVVFGINFTTGTAADRVGNARRR